MLCVALSADCLRRRYRWTQTLESVDVYVPIGTGVRAAQCSVKITGSRLTVGLKGQPPILGKGKERQRVTARSVHAAVFSFRSASVFAPNFVRAGRADKQPLFSFVLHRDCIYLVKGSECCFIGCWLRVGDNVSCFIHF